ncbi:MAG: hypothetical protein L6R28_02515 [Planctomycetes bacterium]|nr:hypothetical protein [Planctomycetota bacterium]
MPSFYRIYDLMEPNVYCLVMAPGKAEQFTREELKKIRRGGRLPDRELHFLLKGKKRGDLVTGEDFYFVSDFLKTLLLKNDVSGIRFFPIKIESKKKSNDVYSLVSVSGKAGPIQGSRRGPILFDLHKWDGSDVFMLDDALHVLVVERVKTLVTEAGLSNIGFERLEKM